MMTPTPQQRWRRNVLMLSAQVVVSSLTLFLLYRHVVDVLGLSALGTWSLVMAFVAFARIAEFGVSQAVSRYVASAMADARRAEALAAVYGGVVLTGMLGVVVAAVVLPLTDPIGRYLVPSDATEAAHLLRWAVLVFGLSNVAAAYQAGLDGLQRADLRAVIAVLANLAQLASAWILVRGLGLTGLSLSQALFYGVLIAGSAALVHGTLGWRASGALQQARRVIRFGVPLQVSAVFVMLLEPTTKLLLGRFGSLADVGLYELCSRLVQQCRGVLVAGLPAMTPIVAALRGDERSADAVEQRASALMAVLVGVGVPTLLVSLPVVSLLWLHAVQWQFVGWAAALAVGWGINSVAAPRYYRLLGEGRAGPTVASHVVMGVCNAGLGLVLGRIGGGVGVVAGMAVSLAIGGIVLLRARSPRLFAPEAVASPLGAHTIVLAAGGLIAAGLGLLIVRQTGASASWWVALFGSVSAALVLWRSPPIRQAMAARVAASPT